MGNNTPSSLSHDNPSSCHLPALRRQTNLAGEVKSVREQQGQRSAYIEETLSPAFSDGIHLVPRAIARVEK